MCLRGHTRQVSTLVWAPDGCILTGSRDGTLRRWDLRNGGSEVSVPGLSTEREGSA
jgi:WD40 repeat protein